MCFTVRRLTCTGTNVGEIAKFPEQPEMFLFDSIRQTLTNRSPVIRLNMLGGAGVISSFSPSVYSHRSGSENYIYPKAVKLQPVYSGFIVMCIRSGVCDGVGTQKFLSWMIYSQGHCMNSDTFRGSMRTHERNWDKVTWDKCSSPRTDPGPNSSTDPGPNPRPNTNAYAASL